MRLFGVVDLVDTMYIMLSLDDSVLLQKHCICALAMKWLNAPARLTYGKANGKTAERASPLQFLR